MSEQQPGQQPPVTPQTVSPQLPVWAAAPTQLVWKESPPLEYHQLLRGSPRYSWWRPLLAVLIGTAFYFILSIIYMVVVLFTYAAVTGTDFVNIDLLALAVPDTREPISLLLTLGSVALMLPSVWLAMLCSGLRPTGRIWSAALKIRWGWLGRTILPAFVALFVVNTVGILVGLGFEAFGWADSAAITDGSGAPDVAFDPQILLWSSLLILLLVPVQATAEEVVFRGAFMQVLGAWGFNMRKSRIARFFRGPILPIMVPSILFGFAHIYDIWGWLAVVSMAVAFGWLTWRTGGLEAAITLHVVNNWVAFGFMVFAIGGETKQTSDGGGFPALIGLLAGLAVYVWWVERSFGRSNALRTRIDHVQAEVPVQTQEHA